MLGKCFSVLCIISFFFGAFTGNMKNVCDAILSGASKSVEVCFSLIGIMALWGGVMAVLKSCGAIRCLSKLLKPILRLVFPRSFKENVATDEITACVSASLLGVANATTPLALCAINEMQKNRRSNVATNDMIMLSMLGCACFNLVPTTVIALRSGAGAEITYKIMLPVWICSGVCCVLGVVLCRILGRVCGDF
ncbi:MAG: hypothetical protein II980_06040 [Clostridia bacterium]|nr:hypothetical protein [Clostridia bacterium]